MSRNDKGLGGPVMEASADSKALAPTVLPEGMTYASLVEQLQRGDIETQDGITQDQFSILASNAAHVAESSSSLVESRDVFRDTLVDSLHEFGFSAAGLALFVVDGGYAYTLLEYDVLFSSNMMGDFYYIAVLF